VGVPRGATTVRITTDNADATSAPGCSPAYGEVNYASNNTANSATINFFAALCKPLRIGGPASLSGGGAIEHATLAGAGFPITVSGFGTLTGTYAPAQGGALALSLHARASIAAPVTSWPSYQHDNLHSGLSPVNTSGDTGKVEWSFPLGGDGSTGPVIGTDGMIYAGGVVSGGFYAINPDGTEKWRAANLTPGFPDAAIGSDGTIYVDTVDPNALVALNPNGTTDWTMPLPNGVPSAPLTLGPDGTIYFAFEESVMAVNPNGTPKWTFSPLVNASFLAPAIGADGTIYVDTYGGTLYALNPANGDEEWSFPPINEYTNATAPAIGGDGTIYFGDGFYLYAVNPNGTEKWAFRFANGSLQTPVAIGANGVIYANDGEFLRAIKASGIEKWKVRPAQEGGVAATVIGADGTIYVAEASSIQAFSPDGVEKWLSNLVGHGLGNSLIVGNLGIGPDGTIYDATNRGLFAVK
jgi:outer membrane protein assembly factor BamB